jgi:hypothetical protein
MRLIVAVAFAAMLLIPAGSAATAGSTPVLSIPQDVSDLSTAKKKKKSKKQAPKKEEYLRAVPSAPPPDRKR